MVSEDFTAPHRAVVSFVRRNTRLSPKLQQAWETNSDHFLLHIPTDKSRKELSVNPSFQLDEDTQKEVWGEVKPLIIEVGSGQGENIAAAAANNPDKNFLAVEVFDQGIAHTLLRCEHQHLENLRIAQVDAVQLFETAIQPQSCEEVWTYFPDPWPKMKHHKRRIIQPSFAHLIAQSLVSHSIWRIATDIDDYALHIHEVLDNDPDFMNIGTKEVSLAIEHVGKGNAETAQLLPHAIFTESERFDGRVLTSFENKGLLAGHIVHDLTYVVRGDQNE